MGNLFCNSSDTSAFTQPLVTIAKPSHHDSTENEDKNNNYYPLSDKETAIAPRKTVHLAAKAVVINVYRQHGEAEICPTCGRKSSSSSSASRTSSISRTRTRTSSNGSKNSSGDDSKDCEL